MNAFKLELEISGMSCNHCVNKVIKALNLEGIINKEVSLEKGNAVIEFDADKITKAEIISAINDTEMYKVMTEKIEKLITQ